jgi:hypothetical protein
MCLVDEQHLFSRLNEAIDRQLELLIVREPLSIKQYLWWKKLLRNLERKRRNCLVRMNLVSEINQKKETGIYWD